MKKWLVAAVLCSIGFLSGTPTNKSRHIEVNDYLAKNNYTKIHIHIIYDKLWAPSPASITSLTEMLHLYCHKEEINVTKQEIAITTSNADPRYLLCSTGLWTTDNLKYLISLNSIKVEKNTLSLYIIYVFGFLISDFSTIGSTFSDNSFVLFRNRINDKWETSILLHEAGHILGLVPLNAINSDHQHRWHCKNIHCIMYWCADDLIGPTDKMDEDCQKLIQQMGGKYY